MSAVERLIDKPSIMLLVIDNWILLIRITELINLGPVPRANSEPIHIGIMTDFLALVEEPNNARSKNVTAEVGSQLPIQIDVFAVFKQTLHVCDIGFFGGVSLCVVGAVGRPSVYWQCE